ncbi:MAG: glycosyltransferase family 2 protein [Pedobacter sp.]|nr:glycosyltransferase family 2 protein [Pedobacter sp.]MDQ8052898.1 glycosyltransferase family 2 protein [Pedobacter sp.]
MNKISASIVFYQTKLSDVEKIISTVLKNTSVALYVVDNSPGDEIGRFLGDKKLTYIHQPANPGFGAAHNMAIREAMGSGAAYHFIINPDIELNEDLFIPMVQYMEEHPDVGMMMPQVLNIDGTIQNLPKLLPHPIWIFRRKLRRFDPWGDQFMTSYELRNANKDEILNVPILSGCFTLLRLAAIREIGMYDENFFMYFEDFDLSRRMHQKYKTIYYPMVSVVHGYEGGANKNFKLFKIFIKSMITYFNKWGWFFDQERKHINQETLTQLPK